MKDYFSKHYQELLVYIVLLSLVLTGLVSSWTIIFYIVSGFIWFYLILSLLFMRSINELEEKFPDSFAFPAWGERIYDLIIVILMGIQGWFLTTIAYILTSYLNDLIRKKIFSLKSDTN